MTRETLTGALDVAHSAAFGRVLVGFDGSHEAQVALRTALALAGDLGSEVHVLMAVRPPPHAETAEEQAKALVAEQENLARKLSALGRPTGGGDLLTHVAVAADPGAALADHAEEHGFDLIVVGCHGRHDHTTRRGIGQSLESLLLRHPCPVLVV